MSETPGSENWHSSIEAPHIVNSEAEIDWTEVSDVVIVGLGAAGIAAALTALEKGLSVTTLDRFDGGGATKASGGVVYAGGGTTVQKAAGVKDSPENMAAYLKEEVGEVISENELINFCRQSPELIDWLISYGVEFRPTLWPDKTSYPAPEYFLYHSDNSLLSAYQNNAYPAARGHRGFVPVKQGAKAMNLGGSIFDPLRDAAQKKGLSLHPYGEVRQLIVNAQGAVIGVKALHFNRAEDAHAYRRLRAKAHTLLTRFPPILPGGKYFMRRAFSFLRQAEALTQKRSARYYRAARGVVLCAGGFAFNSKMLRQHAPAFARGYPLGTEGDNGAGIRLGQSVGGVTQHMDKASAWRFINPPASFGKGLIINQEGKRFINEMVYGATLGVEIAENQKGKAWLIIDSTLKTKALNDVKGKKALAFQRMLAKLNLYFGKITATSLEGLAEKIGCDSSSLKQTIIDYNRAARGETACPFHKAGKDMAELDPRHLIAIDVGISAKLFPCPVLTLGGLKVEESSGRVIGADDTPIPGLYAAGRNAVGIASHNYVSGLSIADGLYSGRKVGLSLSEARSTS